MKEEHEIKMRMLQKKEVFLDLQIAFAKENIFLAIIIVVHVRERP